MRAFHRLLPTDERWLDMTFDQVLGEYQQIVAYRYEERNPGKLFSEKADTAIYDETFDDTALDKYLLSQDKLS